MLSYKPLNLFVLLISSVIYWSCQPASSNKEKQEEISTLKIALNNEEFPYDLSVPDQEIELPTELTEVSGLGFTPDGKISMVQDEIGTLFFLDLEEGQILEEIIEFEVEGDFEGVEIVGDTAYVLRSDGVIFTIYPYNSPEPTIKQYKTDLNSRNDTEGLGYLANSHQLLIACKAVPNLAGKKQKDFRAIYLFNLKPGTFTTQEYLRIPLKNLDKMIGDNEFNRLSKDIAKIFSEGGNVNFQPSGIAVHPITSNVYILASVGKLLVVFNPEGTMVNMIKLDNSIFKQPEGICFSPDGDLFISNEGRKGQGNVLKFNYPTPSENEGE